MSRTPAARELEHALRADSESGVCRFRVFYLRVNGRRSVVPGWRLRETMHRLKLLNLYGGIESLGDGASAEFNVTLYRQPVNLLATGGTWELVQGPDSRPDTAS